MSGIVDFHSHILPGIDDGSASAEESIAMLRMETEQGIDCVVATPHFYAHHDTPEGFLARRQEAEIRLREAMDGLEEMPEIILGAEVYFFPGISDSDAIPELTIGYNRCILIEMPPSPWSQNMYSELEEIQARWGITPIIAHVDRYLNLLTTYGIPQRLEELPVLVQANAGFFLRAGTRARALRMLERYADYELVEIVSTEGENTRGEKYMEFYVDEEKRDVLRAAAKNSVCLEGSL